jgi:hypothetical protein
MHSPIRAVFLALGIFFSISSLHAQASAGTAGTVTGTITDPTLAALPGATVTLANASSGFLRTVNTGLDGSFLITNIPFNPYRLTVSAPGFSTSSQTIAVRSFVPVNENIMLGIATSKNVVTVEAGGDLIETDPTFHTDIDRTLIDELPVESASSSLSSIITLTTPGVSADSNGLFHGLGDHAENAFYLDGQPITDQQSKVFSNQIPSDAVQSMEVISGAPPAEFGEKTSLVAVVTTRSGQGVTTPHGNINFSYGSFGTSILGGALAYGGTRWGNFVAVDGLRSGRFLDPAEFAVLHDRGNEENVFDRVDLQLSKLTSLHTDFQYSRSWFQTPNSYDTLNTGILDPVHGLSVGQADQRSQIGTLDFAPTITRVLSNDSVVNVGAYVRRDAYNYYPSNNPFADLGPIQQETLRQFRTLTNAGVRADYSYMRKAHNFKAGITYQSTFLNENDYLGIVDPLLNAPCLNLTTNNPVGGFNDPSQCAGAGLQPNTAANPNATSPFLPELGCLDLTRPTPSANDSCANALATRFAFLGHTDVKLLSLYVQDAITEGNFLFSAGLRGDVYNGLSAARMIEPRAGIAYNVKRTGTVLRVSYARTMETPFNENLVLSSRGCSSVVISDLIPCVPSNFNPGQRNEFHAGLQQQFGRHLVINGDYIWKYTHNGYDFSVLGATPVTFPVEWKNSKIPGFAIAATVPETHGFTAFVTLSSVAARFFSPQIGGLGTTVGQVPGPFRIDHDERFNQTTHAQYTLQRTPLKGAYIGFNWRFDSGLVAGEVPCYGTGAANDCPQSTTLGGQPAISMQDAEGNPLTADEEFQAGLTCGNIHATPTQALPSTCLASQFGSTLVNVPAAGTENDDHNPPRIKPRSLFDLSVGDDNVLHTKREQFSARLTVINLSNKYALYNFLSTFSGTHYVTPRSVTAEIGFHF